MNLPRLKISIVIPAFNEERLLAGTLAQVQAARQAFTAGGVESELIVCDNNSTDRTAEIARAGGATVVFEPVNQIARARNRGAEVAVGDWLLFIDADSHPSAELFSDVVETIRSGRCLAGGVTIRLEGNYRWANLVTAGWNWVSRRKRLLAGSFIFIDAAVFRTVGGFNNELFVTEELDLSARLRPVAKETGREVVILRRHPLVTSARKIELYTGRDHLRLLWRMMWNRQAAFRDKEACHLWYDGRR